MTYLKKKLQAIISTLDAWKLKTGNLYLMTSNSAPSPFVATNYNSGAIFIYRDPYQSFNNNTTDNYQGSIASGNRFGARLDFNLAKLIKATKVSATMEVGGSGSTVDYKIDLITSSGTIQILNTRISSGGSYNSTVNIAEINQVEIIAIRHYVTYVSGSAVPCMLKKCQITEWYEK